MRKTILLLTLVFSFHLSAEKKNIVMLFVDDLGWADMGFRNKTFHTPNIDQLKKDAMDFERAYTPTPTCSPTRAALMTGKESIRMGFSRHINHENEVTGENTKEFAVFEKDPVKRPSRNWLPLEEVTYAERLGELGYYNVLIGKWHLGHRGYFPTDQGFDEMIGTEFHGHPNNYYQPYFKYANPLAEYTNGEYLTDVITDKAVGFLSSYDEKKPFMMSLWYYTVHGPHFGRKDLVAKYKAEGLTGKYAEYAAMVSALDESVGRVREALVANGLDENTIIIFSSDQGGAFKNGNLRGGKMGGETLCEGGARIPLFVRYPGVTVAGSTNATPVSVIDMYPTLIEIASGEKCKDKNIQGVSLMPLLKGGEIAPRKLYFLRSYEDQYAAVMDGNWKLIKYHSGKYELYNLATDESEQNNLVEVETKKFKQLSKALSKWEEEAIPDYAKGNS